MPRYKKKNNNKAMMINSFKFSLLAVAFTIAAVMIFALAVKNFDLADADISLANQIIKIGGIIYAAFFAARTIADKQLLTAFTAAVIYIAAGFIAFSIIEGQLGDMFSLMTDIVLAAGVGAAIGLLVSKVLNHDKYVKNT